MSQPEHSRLVTFEVDDDERLAIFAGRNEMDKRDIFTGSESGRYAVVPVNALDTKRAGMEDPDELRLKDMRIAGQTVAIPKKGAREVAFVCDEGEVRRMDRPGIYGLLWVPQS